ncbi:HAMP domain-containing sensor histidine kinase [Rhizobium sp.]
MAGPRVTRKWRPKMAFVVYAVLLAVLALPIVIVLWFRAIDAASGRMAPAEIGALAGALALTLGIAYVLTRTITGPIHALIARTDEIARGGKKAIVPLESYGTHEIATLSQSFLDLSSKLVDRTDYVRSFAAHVSHELKSPLTAIRGAAELLRDDDATGPMTAEERRNFLDNIIADSERLGRLLARLRELARAELPTEKGETRLSELVAWLAGRFPALGVESRAASDIPLPLPFEAASIVLGNLADNADQHGATRLELIFSADDGLTMLRVRDNGRGISDGNRALIFQPFFSTRREQGGTGMGLDIVRAVLNAHGGTIRLGDASNPGVEFEIRLPG